MPSHAQGMQAKDISKPYQQWQTQTMQVYETSEAGDVDITRAEEEHLANIGDCNILLDTVLRAPSPEESEYKLQVREGFTL